MAAIDLARAQFAITTSIHWLFVLVTLGLVTALLFFQTRAALSRPTGNRELYYRMTRFWGLMYVINYALGIASGIVMEFQFGTHWSGLSELAGGVFGAPLAMETIIAFVAESTFLAFWIFGWGKLNRWVHLAVLYVVAATAYMSAFWVLVANGFMHNPVGYEMRDGRAVLTDVGAVFANPSTWWAFAHIVGAAAAVGGAVVVGTAGWHLLRRTEDPFFVRSFRTGYVLLLIGVNWAFGTGWAQYGFVADLQPMKNLDLDAAGRAALDADLAARYGPGDYTPPEFIDGMFHMMSGVGETVGPLLVFAAPILIWRLPAKLRWSMPLFMLLVPLPFLAAVAGWVFREVGRQPWVVYGVQRTADAFSGVSTGGMWVSLIGFTAVLLALLVVDWWLLFRRGLRGPAVDVWRDDPGPAVSDAGTAGLLLPQGSR